MLEERRRQPRDPADCPLTEIMTDRVFCTTPETSIESLAEAIGKHGVSGMPVVDAERRALGVVTRTDLVRWAFSPPELKQRKCTVGDLMTQPVITLPPETPIARAAALMSFEGIHRILVARADGKVCGVVSSIDVLEWVARNGGYVGPCPDPRVDPDEPADLGVGD